MYINSKVYINEWYQLIQFIQNYILYGVEIVHDDFMKESHNSCERLATVKATKVT